ncbi:MAG: hypothetical protein ACOC3T_04660 [Bacteroidota bacterium]
MIPVLNRITSLSSLLIIWIIIYFGNLTEGMLLTHCRPNCLTPIGIILKEAMIPLAGHMLTFNAWQILGGGVLAGG